MVRAVSKNFQEIVFDTNKNVLVYFYTICKFQKKLYNCSLGCGFCQVFQPIYDSLAESLSKKENVTLVKIDMSKNGLFDLTLASKH